MNYIRNITSLLLSAVVLCSFKPNRNDTQESLLVIDFQDFFKDDVVSIKYGKCPIMTNQVLTTIPEIGMTGISLTLFNNGDVMISTEKDKPIKCKRPNSQKVYLQVTLNNHVTSYCILLSNGKYVGFSKSAEGNLNLQQSSKQFLYD